MRARWDPKYIEILTKFLIEILKLTSVKKTTFRTPFLRGSAILEIVLNSFNLISLSTLSKMADLPKNGVWIHFLLSSFKLKLKLTLAKKLTIFVISVLTSPKTQINVE